MSAKQKRLLPLRRAVDLHRAGDVHAAAALYFEILTEEPQNAEALHLSGVAAHQLGDIDLAVQRIQQAISLDRSYPAYHNNLANVFMDAGKTRDAERHYRFAVELDPDYPEPHVGLGNVFFRSGQCQRAIEQYLTALRLAPAWETSHYNLGLAYAESGQTDFAIRSFRRTVHLNPSHTDAHINLGHLFRRNQSYAAAMHHYREAIARAPENKTVLASMAKVHRKVGKVDKAIVCIRQILQNEPESAAAWNDLGALYLDQHKYQKAGRCFRTSLELNPNDATVHKNFAMLHWALHDFDKAILSYRKAVFLDPGNAEAYYNLGTVYGRKKEIANAITCYRKAIELKPEMVKAQAYLIRQLQHGCYWVELEKQVDRLRNLAEKDLLAERNGGFPPFLALSISDDPQYNYVVSTSWCKHAYSMIQPLDPRQHTSSTLAATQQRHRPLRIGYLSCDFINHATAHLMRGLFKTHDRARFRIYAYSFGADDRSAYRSDIVSGCDRFVDLQQLSDEEAARKIARDGIDILVDLKGHTNSNRLEILAYRPAPVQAAYLGFPGTCGADFVDYIIGDATVTPLEHREFFSEAFVLLPHCYQVNDIEQEISAEPLSRSSLGFGEDTFVYCSFNEPYKIEPEVFDVWMELLRLTPKGLFWLLGASPEQVRNLRLEANKRGIPRNRLVFSPKIEKQKHLARLRLADLCMDTRTVNGHTTTSDALWAGVPVVTMIGKHFASRVAASLLHAVGLSDCVTTSMADYKDLALGLATDARKLARLRSRLKENRRTFPLFDTPRFVKNLETAYASIWQQHQSRKPPSLIDLTQPVGDGRYPGFVNGKENNVCV